VGWPSAFDLVPFLLVWSGLRDLLAGGSGILSVY
jgi:hypothetical protein